MSLYGDLPTAKDDDAKLTGWATKKLQPAFRKPGSILAPPSVARGGGRTGGRTPTSTGRGGGRGPSPATHIVAQAHAGALTDGNSNLAVQSIHSTFSFFTVNGQPLKDEYDPSKPNDYEDIIKDREKKRKEADEEAERLARMREIEQEIERRKREQAEAAAFVAAASRPPPGAAAPAVKPEPGEDPDAEFTYQGDLGSIKSEDDLAAQGFAGLGSTAAAAAGSNGAEPMDADDYEKEYQRRMKVSGEDAFRARGRMGGPGAAEPSGSSSSSSFSGLPGFNPQQQQQQPGGTKGMGLAQKLLEKMGWREGQGLGRHRQGMATPLVAQKTAAHAGVIVNADLPPDKRPRTGAMFNGPPTRILVLRNMVGPGEVDEELEEEVGTELTKYGTVEDVMIFEVTTPGYPPEETVRIFIKFDRPEASTRALVDLQGRFFGGRQVRAAFFSEDRFDKQQLAPQAGEFGDN